MSELQYFHFLRPYWLLAIIPLAMVVVLLLKRKLTSRSWQSVCDARLLPYLLVGQEHRTAKWPVYVLAFAGVLLITALAGPVWEKLPQPVYRSQAGLVIVLDMSQSMDATDIKPSRATRAKLKIMDILAKRLEGQTALVVYAAEAFVVSPLSDDVKTIESLVTSLSTDLMPYQGSQPALAIGKAVDLLKQGGMRSGNILLITDGLGSDGVDSITKPLAGTSYRVSVLAVGTAGGAPVQLANGGLLKDRYGDIVVPKLQEQPLRSLANSTGGRYTLLTTTDKDIDYLSRGFEFSPVNQNAEVSSQPANLHADIWREEGPWLLLLVAPFAALAFRKGWLSVIFICAMLPLPQPSYALGWDALWKNQNQQAREAFDHGKPQQAAQLFNDKEWQAAAYYKAKNYEKAVELLDKSNKPEDIYNKGNALARLGRIEDAIAAYDAVLKTSPGHEDALYNKQLLEKLLKQQQQQQQKGDSDRQKQGKQQNDQKNDQQQNQSSQQDQQNSQGAQSDDSQQQDQAAKQNSDQSRQEQASQNQRNDDKASAQNSPSDDQMNKDQQSAQAKDDKKDKDSDADASKAVQQNQQDQEDKQAEKQQMAQTPQNSQDIDQAELETMQATEQWLRRIPDDPGGLLRRKFRYQSQTNPQPNREEEPW